MKEIINTSAAPAAIGPYSQAVKAGGLLFVSGQIPLDPESGEFAAGGIEGQTHRCIKNLAAVLAAAGAGLEDVVKTTVFLSDMGNFAAMNGVYAQYFPTGCPARAAVEVARLPKDALVEIEAVAVLG